jgi:hypothetical protein
MSRARWLLAAIAPLGRVDLDVTIDLGPAIFDRIDWATFPDEPGRGLYWPRP